MHPAPPAATCPLTVRQAVDRDFIPIRFQVIEAAAFLDRLARCQDAGPNAGAAAGAPEDFRVAALRRAIAILADTQGDKARRIQESFSDTSTDPIPKAPGQGACGAVPPRA